MATIVLSVGGLAGCTSAIDEPDPPASDVVLMEPTVLDHEQALLRINNTGTTTATFRVIFDEVDLDPDSRFGFVSTLIDPDGEWSVDCPNEAVWDFNASVTDPGVSAFWPVSMPNTCANIPYSELTGGAEGQGQVFSVPTVPLGQYVALADYRGHELTIEAPPGINHYLTGPLWFRAEVRVVSEPESEKDLESELILQDDELVRLRFTTHPEDWKDPVLYAWAGTTGIKHMKTTEEIKHPYNRLFMLTHATGLATHNTARLPDGTVCESTHIAASHMTAGQLSLETVLAKSPEGPYPPITIALIHDLPLPHDQETRISHSCRA